MDAFVGRFACGEAEQAFGAGADGLPDEVTGIHRGHRQQRDSFEVFHGSLWLRLQPPGLHEGMGDIAGRR